MEKETTMSNYTLFVFSYTSMDKLEKGADYFNVLNVGKSHEEVLIEGNAKLKKMANENRWMITEFRVSNDKTQTYHKV
jgi:hypothetical protein